MKKKIICYLLCLLMLLSVSCNTSSTKESAKESLRESVEESSTESVEESSTESVEESAGAMLENYMKVENSPYYFALNEEVKMEIVAKYPSFERMAAVCCYFGEHEGKHVFFYLSRFGAVASMNLGGFNLWGGSGVTLYVWDGNELIEYTNGVCDVFSFEASRQIALIYAAHHRVNSCHMKGNDCVFATKEIVKIDVYASRWVEAFGADINVRVGNYAMHGYCTEQEPLLSGNMGIVAGSLGMMPGEFKETERYVVTLENVAGYESEKFSWFGTVPDIMEMYQITEDMWLDSYEGFNKSEGFDLEKAKTIKYCVPINASDSTKLNVEFCLALDNDQDGNAYILVMRKSDFTGKRYISHIYHYKRIEDEE